MKSSKLKELRKSKGLTLDELAELVGTSKQTLPRYENGIITNVPPEKVESLAEALGTTPSELMGWDEEPAVAYKNVYPVSVKQLPVLGDIACGMPIYAEERHESFVSVAEGLDADFCLKAHGDSMTGARIFDGDVVFIREQPTVENGEIAAVIIDGEATLKRWYFTREEQKLMLLAENPAYPPLLFLGDQLREVRCLGKAVSFMSKL